MPNWYLKITEADASSGSARDTPTPYDSRSEEREGEKRMIYYSPGENSRFSVKDRVRRRRSGLALNQDEGTIISNDGQTITVKWDSGKTQKYDKAVQAPAFLQNLTSI